MSRWSISNIKNVDLVDDRLRRGGDAAFDLMIAACAYESRSIKLPKMLRRNTTTRFAFKVPGSFDCSKRSGDFMRMGFELVEANLQEFELAFEKKIVEYESTLTSKLEKIRIVIDVSSFPRKMLAAILAVLTKVFGLHGFQVTFAYALAAYDAGPSNQIPPNKNVSPVHPIFAGWSKPGLPVTAIVGLGYERGKAVGAVEYLQASDCFLFMPYSPESKYRSKVEKHNASLVREAAEGHVIDYDVLRPIHTLYMLDSVIRGIKSDVKPVLLPFGPKIFFAISMLLGLSYPEVAVWHVSGEEVAPLVDHCATSHICAVQCDIQLICESASEAL